MKSLLALLGIVVLAVALFAGLNHERFFPKRALRPDVVNTPLRSLPPVVDKTPPPMPENPVIPVALAGTNAPTTTAAAASSATNYTASWESQAAERYSAIIDRIRKERTK